MPSVLMIKRPFFIHLFAFKHHILPVNIFLSVSSCQQEPLYIKYLNYYLVLQRNYYSPEQDGQFPSDGKSHISLHSNENHPGGQVMRQKFSLNYLYRSDHFWKTPIIIHIGAQEIFLSEQMLARKLERSQYETFVLMLTINPDNIQQPSIIYS